MTHIDSVELHGTFSTIAVASTNPPNEVSWQSVFWALVPLALNSMAQPCGSIWPNTSSELCFLLRSSPLVCTFDALSVLIQFIFYEVTLRKSPPETARPIARKRFRRAVAEAGANQSTFEELQENRAFRALLFGLGVLPQAQKLFSSSGLFWTKIWGPMFCGSFFIIELVVLVMGRGKKSPGFQCSTCRGRRYRGVRAQCTMRLCCQVPRHKSLLLANLWFQILLTLSNDKIRDKMIDDLWLGLFMFSLFCSLLVK